MGLGNVLLKDDGVGVHAVRELQRVLPRGVRAVDVGTAVLDALHLFEWADRVLAIDAVDSGGPPGTLYTFGVEDVDDPGLQMSVHQMNLLAVPQFLRHRRPKVTILGVQPQAIDYGMELSPMLRTQLPRLVQTAKGIIDSWMLGSQ